MSRSPVVASAALVFFLLGVPVLLVRRLAAGVLPAQSIDIVLIACLVGWVFICRAVIERNEPLDSLTYQRLSPRWQADSLVAQSLIGVGFVRARIDDDVRNNFGRVAVPQERIGALLPPPARPAPVGRDRHELGEGGSATRRPIPTLRPDSDVHDEPAVPPIFDTTEYIVARGDTFWSIAEFVFDDGRLWKSVQELNVGREVAPDVFLQETDELRIGWSVLIPQLPPPPEGTEQ